jgi:hypothetical protein
LKKVAASDKYVWYQEWIISIQFISPSVNPRNKT